MKRIFALLTLICLLISSIGCTSAPSENPGSLPGEERQLVVSTDVAWANYTDSDRLFFSAINGDKMMISSVQHLPLHRIDSTKQLTEFKSDYGDILTLDSGWDEIGSFEEITADFDGDFFAEKSLFLVYVMTSSCTPRYEVSKVYCDGKSLRIHVRTVGEYEVVDCAMGGWLIAVTVERESIKDCTEFDAVMGAENFYEDVVYPEYKSETTHAFIDDEAQKQLAKSALALEADGKLMLFRIRSESELADFSALFSDWVELDSLTDRCDADFFEENELFLVHVWAPSGTLRYHIPQVARYSDRLEFLVSKTPDSDYLTEDISGWLISAELAKSDIGDCEKFTLAYGILS